jgi:hypothetical protein
MDMPGTTVETLEAKPVADGIFEAMTRFTMGGPWSMVVQIDRPGKSSVRAKFVVRVAG